MMGLGDDHTMRLISAIDVCTVHYIYLIMNHGRLCIKCERTLV